MVENVSKHGGQIAPDFDGWDAERTNTLLCQPSVPRLVPGCDLRKIMCHAVNLDGESGRPAEEIQHVGTNRMLTPELQTTWAGT